MASFTARGGPFGKPHRPETGVPVRQVTQQPADGRRHESGMGQTVQTEPCQTPHGPTEQPHDRRVGKGPIHQPALCPLRPGAAVPALDKVTRTFDERAVTDTGRAYRLACAAAEAKVQVPDAHVVEGDRPLVYRAHELDPPPGRVHLRSQLKEGGAGRDAESAMNAVPGAFKISDLATHISIDRLSAARAGFKPAPTSDVRLPRHSLLGACCRGGFQTRPSPDRVAGRSCTTRGRATQPTAKRTRRFISVFVRHHTRSRRRIFPATGHPWGPKPA